MISFLTMHFCACMLFFILIQRPVFCIYNKSASKNKFGVKDFMKTEWNGLYTDAKAAAILTAIPLLLVWFHSHGLIPNVLIPLYVCDIITALVTAIICVADTALYKFWQFKIEGSVLTYLRRPKGAFASVSPTYIGIAFISIILESAFFSTMLITVISIYKSTLTSNSNIQLYGHILVAFTALLVAVILFCIIRGLHIRPDTPIYSYFSNNPFLNHCAVNPLYNFLYTLLDVKDDFANQFQEFDPAYCNEKIKQLFPAKGTPETRLLNTSRPNILIIIWESLCSHFIGELGGKEYVMPNFNRLAKEGVLFTNCWSGSWRTDRGLVCILSGYPSPPTTSIILHTKKLPNLPALPRILRDTAGYATTAVHGGDMKIFHKADYYWASGHDVLIERKHFPHNATSNRWGVHDGYVFSWLADDIVKKSEKSQRWFTTFQTLSSHEPFDVPYNRIKSDKIENAFAYTDDAFGHFIEKLKSSPAWKDLLIIVTGDHGVNLNLVPDKDRNSHIPLLLLGGAVAQPLQTDKLICQTDIPATLLGQMGIPHEDFIFSRDISAGTYSYPFALHTFNNGFIFRDKRGATHYDIAAQKAIIDSDATREEAAKIILQELYTDLSKR